MTRYIKCPMSIKQFAHHTKYKERLLDAISNSWAEEYVYPDCYTDIDRCDYARAGDLTKPYFHMIDKHMFNHLKEIYNDWGYTFFKIHDYWFQQYKKGSEHGWHTHLNCSFTGVYYLDLPEDAPKLQIRNPDSLHEIETIDVKEGDVVIFPSLVLHRSAKNQSDEMKTIISFNMSVSLEKVEGLYDD